MVADRRRRSDSSSTTDSVVQLHSQQFVAGVSRLAAITSTDAGTDAGVMNCLRGDNKSWNLGYARSDRPLDCDANRHALKESDSNLSWYSAQGHGAVSTVVNGMVQQHILLPCHSDYCGCYNTNMHGTDTQKKIDHSSASTSSGSTSTLNTCLVIRLLTVLFPVLPIDVLLQTIECHYYTTTAPQAAAPKIQPLNTHTNIINRTNLPHNDTHKYSTGDTHTTDECPRRSKFPTANFASLLRTLAELDLALHSVHPTYNTGTHNT
eukprot:Lankesteria_metandrocarpae@DN1917_c1_g1_i1.p1